MCPCPRNLVALLLAATPAAATILVPMPDDVLVARSDVIVVGTVEARESHRAGDGGVVTRTTIRVDEHLKGTAGASHVTVVEPGGRIGDQLVHVFGTPSYQLSERVLVFARRQPTGRLRTTGMALGKYRLVRAPGGSLLAARAGPAAKLRALGSFAPQIPALAGHVAEHRARLPNDLPQRFTFLGDPPSRWFDFDRGLDVTVRPANGDRTLGRARSDKLTAKAFAAWTNVPTASARVRVGIDANVQPSVASGLCDGQNIVQFNDPLDELPDLDGCSGVLAVGGFCAIGLSAAPDGQLYASITEGDITLNRRISSCYSANQIAELLTHETGHLLGLGHSSEIHGEGNPRFRDATMYFLAHFDGRGAALRQDDVDGLTALYPGDHDGDGIPDELDECPQTPAGHPADATGCACADPGHVACPPGDQCTISRCEFESGTCLLAPIDCTGGEPCLVGSCDLAAGCSATPAVGFDAVTCAFVRDFRPSSCREDRIPKRYRRLLRRARRRVERVRSLDAALRATRLRKVLRLLDRALVRLERATTTRRRQPLGRACADELTTLTLDARTRVETEANTALLTAAPGP